MRLDFSKITDSDIAKLEKHGFSILINELGDFVRVTDPDGVVFEITRSGNCGILGGKAMFAPYMLTINLIIVDALFQ